MKKESLRLLSFGLLSLLSFSTSATIVPRLETESEFSRKKHIKRAKQEKLEKRMKAKKKGVDLDRKGLSMPSLLNLKRDEKSPYANSLIFSFDNDNILLLDRASGDVGADDFGQTHAMFIKYLRYNKNTGSEWGLEFETGLYTKSLGTILEADGTKRARQNFREISTLSFVKKWPTGIFTYLKNRLEVGVMNEKKPIPGLALWQQGGSDGDTGFHNLIGVETKLGNIGTGPRQLFGGIGIGYGRLIPISWNSDLLFNWNEIDVTVEGNLLYRTIFEGSQASFLARANIPLIRVSYLSNSNKFLSFNIQERILYFPEENSTGTSTTFGLQAQFTTFGLSFNTTIPDGNQNPSFIKYDDKNTIHSITLFGEI